MKKVSETKKLNLLTLESKESEELKQYIIPVIDSVINSYKLRFLTEWERDHSKKPYTSEIQKLIKTKEGVLNLLKTIEEGKITIEIKIKH